MALYHVSAKILSHSTRNTVGAVAYRAGCQLEDMQTGETFNYQGKAVQHVELVVPEGAPQWMRDIQSLINQNRQKGVQALTEKVEAAEYRINSQVWREIEVALHRELTDEQNISLTREYVQDQLCGRGMTALLNFHFDMDPETGDPKPHCHILVAMRTLEEKGFNPKKERSWNAKSLMRDLREQWAHYSNFHLKLNGHDIQIDHRSYHERGIEIEPQPKQGKGILEQERREKGKNSHTVTDKAEEFQKVKSGNLYRIMRRPEIVLEIVTQHHTTFMWADVQKVLHRYIDEVPLFQKMELRLRNSKELLLLRTDQAQKEMGVDQKGHGDTAIYTTKTLLKAEASLVERAELLANAKTHGVDQGDMETEVTHAAKMLGLEDGFSADQMRAIHHLVNPGQLRCLVGLAGSGKTTLLKVCHSLWRGAGYDVHGLAPTGKAAQNLEQSGIRSTTIHKFLKEFEAGRCQYNPQTVLVLDEAGMVDVERFSSLLNAVHQLGVKLIVVGDGAQLQPVEAGPAFRLVTGRVGKAELTTVLRQKEDWQKQATVLFGKQQTQAALQQYRDKGHVHIIDAKLPSLAEVIAAQDWKGLVNLFEVANRVSALVYREMAQDVAKGHVQGASCLIKDHQDFGHFLSWKDLEKGAASHIFKVSAQCRPHLEAQSVDTLKIAMALADKSLVIEVRYDGARALLKEHELDHLMGITKTKQQAVELRKDAKEALLTAWHKEFQSEKEAGSLKESPLVLAFSNRDVDDLNANARHLLKTSGHLEKTEFTYTLKRETEDDFGKKHSEERQKGFSKGDRIVFTRNNYGLEVKNGTMGTIVELTSQKIQVKLDDKEISFAPNLNPFFDHGWAVTIHKSQGTTVDKAYVLASCDMTQNLSYVAMTRHREDVQVFGSSLEFWREEKLPEMLAKSGEKLSAADYLDATSLEELMRKEDNLLTKIFGRLSDELGAMGAVSKKAFWEVADRFLGVSWERDNELKVSPDLFSKISIREETRAEALFQERNLPPEIPLTKTLCPSFNELKKLYEERLHTVMEKEGNILTKERKQRFAQQAEKTATFLLQSHHRHGLTPSEQEIAHASLRAKYELKRIPQIREEAISEWKSIKSFKESERILAHSIAERHVSIEGRLYFDAKSQGLKTPPNIAEIARQELKEHRAQTAALAQRLATQHDMSTDAATHCAKDVLRYKEVHGIHPSQHQITAMAHIATALEHKDYGHLVSLNNAHEVEFFRRREGDSLFNHISHELEHNHTHDLHEAIHHEMAHLSHEESLSLPHDLHAVHAHLQDLFHADDMHLSDEIEHMHDRGHSI